jgi:hypothetical protein
MSTTKLAEAAKALLAACDKSVYTNDYCGLEVSKHDAAQVNAAIEALRAALASYEATKAVPPTPKLTYTGGWWAITGARLIVESIHPVGYTTHRELDNAERKKWADWFKALKDAT